MYAWWLLSGYEARARNGASIFDSQQAGRIGAFHFESLVELDYGGLATYLDSIIKKNGGVGIEADTSVEDLHFSLTGLAQGDGAMAGQGYEKLISRWRRVAAIEQSM